MAESFTVADIRASTVDSGFNQNPYYGNDVINATSVLDNATTVDDVKDAVSNVIRAVQISFDKFIEDQRTLHNNEVATVADEQTTTTQSNNTQTGEILNGVRAVTAPISEDARKARQALGDGILGRISDNVTNFTSSLKPILPSLQTFGIAFATTGLGAMFMTNALISAIKFIFNNPMMFIGSLIGGSILYNIFKEPINNFITKITDKLKNWISDILAKALTKTIANTKTMIQDIIKSFFDRLDSSTIRFFNRVDTSIDKLQSAINDSWETILADIDNRIETIFDTHIPTAISLFFDTFNEKIPTIIGTVIKQLDLQLPKSTEYSKIISTVDGATNALNSFQTFYNSNKERFDKLIDIASKGYNVLGRNKGVVKGAYNAISRFIPDSWKSDNKSDTTDKPSKSDISIPNVQPLIKPQPIEQPTVVNNKVTIASQPTTTTISNAVGNALGKGLVFAAQEAKDNLKSNFLGELNKLGEDIKKTTREKLGPVKDDLDKFNNKLSRINKDFVELKDEIHSSINLIKLVMPHLFDKQQQVSVNVVRPLNSDSVKRNDDIVLED